MSQELFYTSAPSGLRPGSRGFCTVMSTSGMAKNLADRLEALSGYRHVFAPNDPKAGLNPVVYSHLRITVGGLPLHVLSRVCAAGLDYTQRSNKFAHHVVLDQKELVPAGPAAVLATPAFMEATWEGEPRVVGLGRKPPRLEAPAAVCRTWEKVTGDAGWAGVLAETAVAGPSRVATVIFQPGMDTLALVAEALALLPSALRWQVTFSTYYTKLPPEVQCQWRFALQGSPEAKAAQRSPQMVTIDLTSKLSPAVESPWVIAARTGKAPKQAIQAAQVAVQQTASHLPQTLSPIATAGNSNEGYELDLGAYSDVASPRLPKMPSTRFSRKQKSSRSAGKLIAVVAVLSLLFGAGAYFSVKSLWQGYTKVVTTKPLSPKSNDQALTRSAAISPASSTSSQPPETSTPLAGDDTATTNQNTATSIDVLGNDSDPGGTLVAASLVLVAEASHGTTSVDPTTGVITYTPAPNYTGPDSLTYKVKDNHGADSNLASVSITVNAPIVITESPLVENAIIAVQPFALTPPPHFTSQGPRWGGPQHFALPQSQKPTAVWLHDKQASANGWEFSLRPSRDVAAENTFEVWATRNAGASAGLQEVPTGRFRMDSGQVEFSWAIPRRITDEKIVGALRNCVLGLTFSTAHSGFLLRNAIDLEPICVDLDKEKQQKISLEIDSLPNTKLYLKVLLPRDWNSEMYRDTPEADGDSKTVTSTPQLPQLVVTIDQAMHNENQTLVLSWTYRLRYVNHASEGILYTLSKLTTRKTILLADISKRDPSAGKKLLAEIEGLAPPTKNESAGGKPNLTSKEDKQIATASEEVRKLVPLIKKCQRLQRSCVGYEIWADSGTHRVLLGRAVASNGAVEAPQSPK